MRPGRSAAWGVVALAMAVAWPDAPAAQDRPGDPRDPFFLLHDWVAAQVLAPSGQAKARCRAPTAYAVVMFDIAPDGLTENARLTAAHPDGCLGPAALDAIRRWRYQPFAEPDGPRSRSAVTVMFGSGGAPLFAPRGDTPAIQPPLLAIRVPPAYPCSALIDRTAGAVTVGYTIATDGTTAAHRVVEADPPDLFDAAAIEAVRQYRYYPMVVDGLARPADGHTTRVVFDPLGVPIPARCRQSAGAADNRS